MDTYVAGSDPHGVCVLTDAWMHGVLSSLRSVPLCSVVFVAHAAAVATIGLYLDLLSRPNRKDRSMFVPPRSRFEFILLVGVVGCFVFEARERHNEFRLLIKLLAWVSIAVVSLSVVVVAIVASVVFAAWAPFVSSVTGPVAVVACADVRVPHVLAGHVTCRPR